MARARRTGGTLLPHTNKMKQWVRGSMYQLSALIDFCLLNLSHSDLHFTNPELCDEENSGK